MVPEGKFFKEKSKKIISLGTVSYGVQGNLFCWEIQENFSLGTVSYGAKGYIYYRQI